MRKGKWFIAFWILLLLTGCGRMAASYFTQTPETVSPTKPVTSSPTSTTVLLIETPTPTVATHQGTYTPISAPVLMEQLPSGSYIVYLKVETVDNVNTLSLHVLSDHRKDYGMLVDDVGEHVTLSPDRETITYPDYISSGSNDNNGFYELALINLKTLETRNFQIPDCDLSGEDSAWSPDGKQMAVSCLGHISIVEITGDNLSVVSSFFFAVPETIIFDLSWSPDGKYLSFYSDNLREYDSEPGPYLFSSKCPQSKPECQITPTSFGVKGFTMAKWTPDNLIAAVKDNYIKLFDPITKKVVRTLIIPNTNYVESFAWSPDNRRVVYSFSGMKYLETYIISSDGGQPTFLSEDGDEIMFWLVIK
jgi:WD40 repeat protein